jgi:dTDP-4-amino-4,6-dideoxygalactose transaminase
MGLCNLRHIDDTIAARRAAAVRYRERLQGIDGVQLNVEQTGVESNYAYFPIVFHPEKCGCTCDEVATALSVQGVGTRRYFYPLTSTATYFGGAYTAAQTPVAAKIAQRVLCLPLFEGLTIHTVDRICDVIISLVR